MRTLALAVILMLGFMRVPTSKVRAQADAKNSKANEQAIKIASIPSITIADKKKDFLDHVFDWGPWTFTLVLVCVGIYQSVVLRGTLAQIQNQADSLKQQVTDSTISNAENAITASETLAALNRQASLLEQQVKDAKEANLRSSETAASTLEAMTAQGLLMKRQVDFMAIPYQPWIEFENWTGGGFAPEWFHVKVHIKNPTAYPITIKSGYIKIIQGEGSTEYLVGQPIYLTPSSLYPIEISFPISDGDWGMLNTSGLVIEARGEFTYTGVLGENSTSYPVAYRLTCTSSGTGVRRLAYHMIPKPAIDSEQE